MFHIGTQVLRAAIAALLGLSLLLSSSVFAQTCTTTLNPGANIASAISSASSGSTICLNSGSYGGTTVTSVTKSSPGVTVRSTTGVGASISSISIVGSSWLTFSNLTIPGGVDIDGGSGDSKNISILNSIITGGGQLTFNVSGNTASNVLIDGNTFGGYTSGGFEGTVYIWRNPQTGGSAGITISHNTFNGGSCADGIQVTGSASGITIGPGNTFQNWVQGSCGPHVDAIQFVDASSSTITGNYFNNNTVNSGIYDGGANLTITNNVYNTGNGSGQHHQIGGVHTMNMSHNTFRNNTLGIGTKFANSPNSGWVVQNNIFVSSDFTASGDQPGCGSDCIMRYNLKDASSSTTPTGTNNISGSPTFIGGTNPSTWAGWELTPASLGSNAGNDGQDMGTLYYGTTGTPLPIVSTLTCSPTTIQSVGTTNCTVTASDTTSYAWAVSSCGSPVRCSATTPTATGSTTYTCSFGGSCTPCVTATGPGGTSAQFCTATNYLTVRYRKPSSFGVQ